MMDDDQSAGDHETIRVLCTHAEEVQRPAQEQCMKEVKEPINKNPQFPASTSNKEVKSEDYMECRSQVANRQTSTAIFEDECENNVGNAKVQVKDIKVRRSSTSAAMHWLSGLVLALLLTGRNMLYSIHCDQSYQVQETLQSLLTCEETMPRVPAVTIPQYFNLLILNEMLDVHYRPD